MLIIVDEVDVKMGGVGLKIYNLARPGTSLQPQIAASI
jgi:hypothetical protein